MDSRARTRSMCEALLAVRTGEVRVGARVSAAERCASPHGRACSVGFPRLRPALQVATTRVVRNTPLDHSEERRRLPRLQPAPKSQLHESSGATLDNSRSELVSRVSSQHSISQLHESSGTHARQFGEASLFPVSPALQVVATRLVRMGEGRCAVDVRSAGRAGWRGLQPARAPTRARSPDDRERPPTSLWPARSRCRTAAGAPERCGRRAWGPRGAGAPRAWARRTSSRP